MFVSLFAGWAVACNAAPRKPRCRTEGAPSPKGTFKNAVEKVTLLMMLKNLAKESHIQIVVYFLIPILDHPLPFRILSIRAKFREMLTILAEALSRERFLVSIYGRGSFKAGLSLTLAYRITSFFHVGDDDVVFISHKTINVIWRLNQFPHGKPFIAIAM